MDFHGQISSKGKEKAMFEEKNGIKVLVIGKRIIVYDQEANVVDKEKLHNYAWEVKNG